MWSLLVVCASLHMMMVVMGGPVPASVARKVEGVGGQDHQVDSMEVHHDVDADIKNQKLENDHLPEADEVAREQLNQKHIKQHNIPIPAVPAHDDDVMSDPVDNQDKKLNLNFVKNMEILPVEKLVPADHMDVVKMEHDGHLNKDYHKEMFLGGRHVEFQSEHVENAETKLREIVAKADLDGDGFLSKLEMEKWILDKMMEHFEEAKRENDEIYKHLDPDGDGLIKWDEYYIHFLLSRGFSLENVRQHVYEKHYDESVKLDQDDKDALVAYKFKWTDSDMDPTDNQLSKDEFMNFRHPEHSRRTLESMANNVFRGLDQNDDGILTEDEVAALPPGEVEGKDFQEMDRKWQEERRAEFREIMDANNDKTVSMEEMMEYLNPMNPVQAKLEAGTLLSLMDDDRDNLLSNDEILKHSDIFMSSKIVNFGANVHDEF